MRLLSAFFILISFATYGQQEPVNSAKIYKKIQKVGVLNRVLYFAAHPDDENTRLISYINNGLNATTAYMSLTRGDGGQNLIGDEKGALLGVIRTQELLEARNVDGGIQFFSRAVDFGYSKNPDETFKHWNKDSLLADAVLVIRKFKPDVIVTRFPPDSRAGHGHHTVSAIIAAEAMDLANDSTKFPESFHKYGNWKVQKLYWNESSWWNKEIAQHADEYTTVNIGEFDNVLGVSYSEIASISRSQHQSQGFGMSIQRGDRTEYMRFIKGDSLAQDVLQGAFRSWESVEGGKAIGKKWSKIASNFNPQSPSKSVDGLVDLYFAIQSMPNNDYKVEKLAEVKELIVDCAGLWFEFKSNKPLLVTGNKAKVESYAISQSGFPFTLKSVDYNNNSLKIEKVLSNKFIIQKDSFQVGNKTSGPYWLEQDIENDFFVVADREQISNPKNQPIYSADFVISTQSGDIAFTRPLVYKWTDRVRGELYRQTNIVAPLSIEFDKKVTLAQDNKISVRVRANQALDDVMVQLEWGEAIKGTSVVRTIEHLNEGQTIPIEFELTASLKRKNTLRAKAWTTPNEIYTNSLIEIEYPHIQTQVILPQSALTLIKDSIKVSRKNFGYIVGSGDEIPAALEELGCKVTILDPTEITVTSLAQFDGVIVGIRAYNKVKEMKSVGPMLKEYVKEGGFVMVQYNTNRGMVTSDIGPYPIKLSRTRVTEEDAKAVLMQRDHPVTKIPNVLTSADFDGWVQERGLYFAGEWDEKYTPIVGWNDTGEELATGSLLVTDYGKGHYVFTGISFFRQLPAGVPGAYKLFANLLSYGAE